MNRPKLIRSFAWASISLFLSAGWGNGCTDSDGFRGSPSIVAGDLQLHSTYVSAVLNTPMAAGRNVVWCSTFQLAWNEACSTAGGDLGFAKNDPMVADLNRHSVGPADLDPDSYIAVAGRVRDGIFARIDREVRQKFGGRAKPKIKPGPGSTDRPQDIVSYCFLFQKLDFPEPFERISSPIDFGGTKVNVFGMDRGKPGHEKMADGVLIDDYKSGDDFVIELKTKTPKDHLLLAKVEPAGTLGETVESVRKRFAAAKPSPAFPADVLMVPRMYFDVTRSYRELTGQPLIAPPAVAADLSQLVSAEQNVTFEIDEKGVVLQSEASTSIGCSAKVPPPAIHVLVFDKPFLLMLLRDGRTEPYLAVWIDNPELLEQVEH